MIWMNKILAPFSRALKKAKNILYTCIPVVRIACFKSYETTCIQWKRKDKTFIMSKNLKIQ